MQTFLWTGCLHYANLHSANHAEPHLTVSPFLKQPLRSEAQVRALRIEKVCRELLRDIPATIRDAIAGDLNDREILLLFAQMRFERECNL